VKSTKFKTVFLICAIYTLYTLIPDNRHFKSLKINTNHSSESEEYICKFLQQETFSSLQKILNKTSIRQFSYILLNPLLQEKGYYSNLTLPNNIKIHTEIILLKKYLNKFKFIYKRYFLSDLFDLDNMPTDKEVNYFAITSLMLIVGI